MNTAFLAAAAMSSNETSQAKMTSREAKAHALVAAGAVSKAGNEYHVRSESSDVVYRVWCDEHGPVCSCPDFARRHAPCKHVLAAGLVAQREQELAATVHTEQPDVIEYIDDSWMRTQRLFTPARGVTAV